jgi:hypothetical protein
MAIIMSPSGETGYFPVTAETQKYPVEDFDALIRPNIRNV